MADYPQKRRRLKNSHEEEPLMEQQAQQRDDFDIDSQDVLPLKSSIDGESQDLQPLRHSGSNNEIYKIIDGDSQDSQPLKNSSSDSKPSSFVHVKDQACVHQGDNNSVHNHFYPRSQEPNQPEADNGELRKLLESLSFKRMDARLQNIATALPRTCKWLFHHKHFLSWSNEGQHDEHNGFLWIKGKPGCGKSTIMKSALAWAEKNWGENLTIVSYFFNARAPDSLEKSSFGLYRSLTHQILSAVEQLKPMFLNRFSLKTKTESVDEWTQQELQEFLIEAVQSPEAPRLCIFIDALDEGTEDDIRKMVSFFEELSMHIRPSGHVLRICLSSRHYPHISIERGITLVVEDQTEHDRDIEIYVRRKLAPKSIEMDELCEEVCRKSSKIFLWVILVVSMLKKIQDHGGGLHAMRNRLDQIPEDLNGLFDEILNKNSDEIENCVLLLQWMLFSMRPLEPAELYLAVQHSRPSSDATACDDQKEVLCDENKLYWYMLNCSRGLVELTKSRPPTIQFIHETVRAFLMEENGLSRINNALSSNIQGLSHELLRTSCNRYIRSCKLYKQVFQLYHDEGYCTRKDVHSKLVETLAEHPLIEYSVTNVLRHADKAQEHSVPQEAFIKSLGDSRGLWHDQDLLFWLNVLEQYAARKYKTRIPVLYLMVDRNLEHLSRLLIEGSADVNARGGRYGNALQAACIVGNERVVQHLIDNKVKVNAWGGEHGHALIAAIMGKKFSIVEILRRHGARPASTCLGDALRTAVARNALQCLQILIDLGADPNSTKPNHEPVIFIAVRRRQCEMANLLLQHGADVNGSTAKTGTTRGVHGLSPLQLASDRGFVEMVKLLINAGADINWTGGGQGSALSLAVKAGHTDIFQVLLEAGADVNISSGTVNAPLTIAVNNDRADYIHQLLKRKSDLNASNPTAGKNTLPLLCAIEKCFETRTESIVRLLLDHGADVSLQGLTSTKLGSAQVNALQCASYLGCTGTMRVLLEHGADVNSQGGTYGTALQAASCAARWSAVKLLLRRGADVNAGGGKYSSALCAVVSDSFRLTERQQILKGLLDHGADINAVTPDGQHVLVGAVKLGNEGIEMVKLLLQRAPSVRSQSDSDRSVWDRATKQAIKEASKCLYGSDCIQMTQVLEDGPIAARTKIAAQQRSSKDIN